MTANGASVSNGAASAGTDGIVQPAANLTVGAVGTTRATAGSRPRVGVLAYQGSVEAHCRALERCGAEALPVRHPGELGQVEALILPGGESTTMKRLLDRFGLAGPIRERIDAGMPVFGTCAGLILLARTVLGGTPSTIAAMDITAHRNAYGRQAESFEAEVEVPALGGPPVPGVFIRAPKIAAVGDGVEVLAELGGEVVAARQNRMLVTAFHPELTGDLRFHRLFLQLIEA